MGLNPYEMKPKKTPLKYYEIWTLESPDPIKFTGRYLPERQSDNWHYYEGDDGRIYHFRKQNMTVVRES